MNANVRVIPKKIVTVIEPKRNLMVDKEKHRQLRVAAYCRVSTGSEEQMTSYTNQKKAYTELISQKKEWCLAGIYADQGLSGTQTKKRDEFNRMIEDCKKGKIDYIITKSVSRFARNTVDCLEYVRMLKAMGIGVLFEEQNIDTLKCDSELYLVIYAGFAQSESENISKNITWTFRKNFEEGKDCPRRSRGSKTYIRDVPQRKDGYRNIGNTPSRKPHLRRQNLLILQVDDYQHPLQREVLRRCNTAEDLYA